MLNKQENFIRSLIFFLYLNFQSNFKTELFHFIAMYIPRWNSQCTQFLASLCSQLKNINAEKEMLREQREA